MIKLDNAIKLIQFEYEEKKKTAKPRKGMAGGKKKKWYLRLQSISITMPYCWFDVPVGLAFWPSPSESDKEINFATGTISIVCYFGCRTTWRYLIITRQVLPFNIWKIRAKFHSISKCWSLNKFYFDFFCHMHDPEHQSHLLANTQQ